MYMGGGFGYRVLRLLRPPRASGDTSGTDALSYAETFRRMLGEDWADQFRGRTVVDFGCGGGRGSIELAQCGAARVIGVDIRETALEVARDAARQAGVADRCVFTTSVSDPVDVVVSVDAFEHFSDPGEILRVIHGMLREGGSLVVSFGPTWYHPRGGHFFSIFPWSHLMFSERAQIRWRADFKDDGATRFSEVAGGLNQMTIRQFEKLVADNRFEMQQCRLVPIRPLRRLHNRATREFTTSLVECVLVKPQAGGVSPRRHETLQ